MHEDFLNDLNPAQRAAVEYVSGPSLIIAGAGSGKTRALTYKIAHLLRLGLKPWEILALTFTNKSAREMESRVAQLIDPQSAASLCMGTFHSVFSRILRREAEAVGFASNFTIYTPNDVKSLLKAIVKDLQLDEETYKPALLAGRIGDAKNGLILPEQYRNDSHFYQKDLNADIPRMADVYDHYMARLQQSNAMDFDDLLLRTYLLFRQHDDIRQRYAMRFRFVLVDEYQDTNYAQHEILHLLCRERQMISVVGDDAQSIYGFRGANIDNILTFTRTYEGAQMFKLEQNYRSTQTIVAAANSIIARNRNQIKKEVFSQNAVGQPITLNIAYSDVEEGEIVVGRIDREHHRDHIPLNHYAILYRTNALCRIFEESLRKHGLPYKIYGGHSFYDQKEIRDALSYFRLIVNPYDEEALKRIINYPARGIGAVTVNKLLAVAQQHNLSPWQVLQHPEVYDLGINRGAQNKLTAFVQMMTGFISDSLTTDAYTLGCRVLSDSGLMAEASRIKDTKEGEDMRKNFNEMLSGMNDFVSQQRETDQADHVSLSEFLSEVALLTDTDKADHDAPSDVVTLMTIHAAKGLEFDTVFIVGMEKDLFPNAMATNSMREMEEERRLFYVALTRAKQRCFLSCAKQRFHFGTMDFCDPSPFLNEIDRQYLRLEERRSGNWNNRTADRVPQFSTTRRPVLSERPTATPMRPAAPASPTWRRIPRNDDVKTSGPARQSILWNGRRISVGQHVIHQRFGPGTVRSLEGSDASAKAVVEFENTGTKTLLLKYAQLTLC